MDLSKLNTWKAPTRSEMPDWAGQLFDSLERYLSSPIPAPRGIISGDGTATSQPTQMLECWFEDDGTNIWINIVGPGTPRRLRINN